MPKTKILYVEDEPFLAKIVKESLESRDFLVRLIDDGSRAMEAFQHFDPDICVLDVMLPKQDGFSIARQIRSRDSRVPIIFLTAKDQTLDLVNGFSSGGNDYVKKPFSMEELIIRINNLLQMTRNGENPGNQLSEYNLGSFSFYPEKMELQNDDHVRQLSYRETEILQLLCIHKNETIQRKDILLKVWGDDSYFNSRNLDVYIKKLRSYLERDPTIKILTLKGVGYRFIFH